MTKLPEPYSTVGSLLGDIGTFAAMGYNLRRGDGLYTEAQMLQFRRDALEEAAMVAHDHPFWLGNKAKEEITAAILKLKDET